MDDTLPQPAVPGSSVPGSSVPGSSVPGATVPGASVPGATGDAVGSGDEGSWLWAHAGRLAGVFLGLVAFAVLVLLAVAGYSGAYLLLALIVGGLTMIIVGGRLRGR